MGCDMAREFLSQNNIEFEYYDITESMNNLKMFLKYRDYAPEFDRIKADGKVGLPCIITGEERSISFDYRELELEKFKEREFTK